MAIQILKRGSWIPEPLRTKVNPRTELGRFIAKCIRYLPVEMGAELIDKLSNVVILESRLYIATIRCQEGYIDYGLVSKKVITDVGVGFLVDAWQNLVELEAMKYHGIGTGGTAEDVADTALVAESTTALNPDSTRATGSLGEGGASNIFRTIGTLTADATIAVTEHGLFNVAPTGTGVLFDRSIFSVKNIDAGDAIQITYDMVASSGG